MIQHKYGCKLRKHKDERDLLFKAAGRGLVNPEVDFRPKFQPIPIMDQGVLSSCTGNGWARILEYFRVNISGLSEQNYSRLMIYWLERQREGTVLQDGGAEVGSGAAVLSKIGVALETLYPYDVEKFTEEPSDEAYRDAAKNVLLEYQRCPTLEDVRAAHSNGFPSVFGMMLYSQFESSQAAKTGVIATPTRRSRFIGGHCMHTAGHSDSRKVVYAGNSWSDEWGLDGYCEIPYDYWELDGQVDDCYIITKMKFED